MLKTDANAKRAPLIFKLVKALLRHSCASWHYMHDETKPAKKVDFADNWTAPFAGFPGVLLSYWLESLRRKDRIDCLGHICETIAGGS